VPLFLVESPVQDNEAFETACERARRVADGDVTYVRSTLLPGGGIVLHLFDAPGEAALETAGRRAGLDLRRIVPTTKGDDDDAA
jgi:hypothetical protein